MNRHPSDAMFARIGSYAKAWPAIVAWVCRVFAGPPTYRPGAHYMRGPGPKWREKNLTRRS